MVTGVPDGESLVTIDEALRAAEALVAADPELALRAKESGLLAALASEPS